MCAGGGMGSAALIEVPAPWGNWIAFTLAGFSDGKQLFGVFPGRDDGM
jgi:hypothetical protein